MIAEWDDGDFSAVLPHGEHLPFQGLRAIIDYAIARGESRQQELVGYEQISIELKPVVRRT